MNSFTTNTLSAHDTLCSRESMQEAVKTMHTALHEDSLRGSKTKVPAPGRWIANGKTRIQAFSATHMPDW